MAQGWNTNVATLGVSRASNYDAGPEQGAKLAVRLRANPWLFDRAADLFEGIRRKYGSMIEKNDAGFLTFGWLATGPLTKLEGLVQLGTGKAPNSIDPKTGLPKGEKW